MTQHDQPDQPVIKLRDICFAYPGSDPRTEKLILDHLNLDIRPGDRIGMMAPNGSGKTTLLHTIMGLCRPKSGTVEIFGRPMKTETDFASIRTRIGLLFQDSDDQLFCPSVLEDVAFGPLNLGVDRNGAVQRAEETLDQLGIGHLKNSVTHRLSGGQKRLVAFAAVLAMGPDVLLLDEPTAGLDRDVKQSLMGILNKLNHTCLVISHEFDFVSNVTDKIYSMEAGRILTDDEIHVHYHEHVHKHGKQPHDHR